MNIGKFKRVRIGEAARMLGVTVRTMRRWDTIGELSPGWVSPGRHRYYYIEQLAAVKTELIERNTPSFAKK